MESASPDENLTASAWESISLVYGHEERTILGPATE